MSTNKSHPHGTNVPNSLGTKVPHPHAESMLLYAQDAMETDKPWERWEMSFEENGYLNWYPLVEHPTWTTYTIYRRKPRTILINGIEVPEPVKVELDYGQSYFGVDPAVPNMIAYLTWGGDSMDKRFLERGLIHLTEENARKHAEALLSFTRK